MTKFVSDWHKGWDDFHFPEGMPDDLRSKVISRRRQILTYAYIIHGIGEEIIGEGMWTRMCKDLEGLQAAWGHEFGFYDFMFDGWDHTKDDHLMTNRGVDSGVMNHALGILQRRKLQQRKAAQDIAWRALVETVEEQLGVGV